jgi:hypothetical protein
MIGSDRLKMCEIKVEKPLREREVKQKLEFGDENLMVWDCIGWN